MTQWLDPDLLTDLYGDRCDQQQRVSLCCLRMTFWRHQACGISSVTS